MPITEHPGESHLTLRLGWDGAAGGGKGIGLACASCLGHEGCKIVVADIDDAEASRHAPQFPSRAAIMAFCWPILIGE